MADYVFIRKSRNKLSSILHVFLNILLGAGSILVTVISGSWIIGMILVFISKWRIFAVRPRFWFLNIKSNLVDIIVGASLVLIAYCYGGELLPIHIILAVFYVFWLVLFKPLTSENGTIIQSLFAIFFGTTATILLTSTIDSIVLVIVEFIIGYSASRHLLAQKSEGNFTMTTLVSGLLFAEIALLSSAWSILYPVKLVSAMGIQIPQLSIILTIISFSFFKIYYSIEKHDGKIIKSDIAAPAIFAILTVAIIIFAFSNPIFNI
ncbi:hypothetical protein IKG45_01220 [Candidatus Saccharibacteria bacterium]|nr:hypothetical protein [Candidatus Saccharibacteria bacterium]